MAKNFVTIERLELFWTKVKTYLTSYLSDNSYVKDASYVHTDSNYTAAEKTKLAGVEEKANNYSLPAATSSTLGGVKTGDNITNTSGTISLTKANVTSALGYTPPTKDTTYSNATTTSAGLMSAADKSKVDGIAEGAEVNQNAFSNVVIGNTTVAADSKTDSLILAGSNVTLTPDITNDKVTIGITKDNVTAALGYTPPTTNTTYSNATTSAAGLMSATDKTKLDKVADGAEVNQNAFSNVVVGSTTVAADSKTDSLTLAGSNVTLTPDADNDKITIGITKTNVTTALGYTPPTKDTTYSAATTSAAGLMSATDKAKLDGIAEKANNYTLPAASSSTLGGVKVGSNISVASDGTISVPAMDWSNINNKPTKLSEFTNDGVFITKAVSDLTNYYKKSEVYTQAEVNTLLSKITSISVEVVTALPTTGTNGIIYLVSHSHGTGDAYDEYVWVSSKSAFEKIGSTDIDLSNYWTKTDLTECTEDEIIALFS
jgi:2-keto-3-deoxy-6-phosphogluconate aldolase